MRGGYFDEAMAWRDWLLRAVAGDVSRLQIMYGPAGERRLDEWEAPWLPGYESSAPVRIGNAASGQYQLDVYGEVMSALLRVGAQRGRAQPRRLGPADPAGRLPRDGVDRARRRDLGGARAAPSLHPLQGDGLGGRRPGRRVPSRSGPTSGGPLEEWRALRHDIFTEVCEKGYNEKVGCLHPVLRRRTSSTPAC